MRIISFGWTTPPLVAGVKVVTRRHWKDRFADGHKKGEKLQAWNQLPRVPDGRRIGTVELVEDVYQELTRDMLDEDYELEGFKWLNENQEFLPKTGPIAKFIKKNPGLAYPMEVYFEAWRNSNERVYVVRFKLVEMTVTIDDLRERLGVVEANA